MCTAEDLKRVKKFSLLPFFKTKSGSFSYSLETLNCQSFHSKTLHRPTPTNSITTTYATCTAMWNTDADVDPAVWKAIAGSSVQIPRRSAHVYYFPQGHLENSSATPIQSYNLFLRRPFIQCQVSSVQFLSNESDQVYAKIHLQCLRPHRPRLRDIGNNSENEQNDVTSYAKILTRSDVNKQYGRFSVPKSCAELIFPQIDFSAELPTAFKDLVFKDTSNIAWAFRHVYGCRHWLTTGWNRFVNSKKLVAGDSVVFIRKNSTNELFIGIRRAIHANKRGRWNFPLAKREEREALALKAISMADKGISFDVEYYPRVGTRDFIVSAEKVEEAWFGSNRCPGMRVKMAVETDLFSKMKWFWGTISAIDSSLVGTWFASPWRVLQVAWDDHKIMKNMKQVSPWEVECVLPTEQLSP